MAVSYDKSNLPFKVRGSISTGCRYVLVKWKAGNASDRTLVSCHRKQKAAREKLASYQGKSSASHKAIYDLRSGKRVPRL